jgi:PAS domain S-box-containing protein
MPLNEIHLSKPERAIAEAELLAAIATTATENHGLGYVLSSALEQLSTVIPFDAGLVAVLDDDELVVQAASGVFSNIALGQHLSLNDDPQGYVIETGEALLYNGSVNMTWTPAINVQSCLAAPLFWHGRVVGLIALYATKTEAFDAADQKLLQNVAMALSAPIALVEQLQSLQMEVLDRKRAQRRLAAQYKVTQILAEAPSFPDVAVQIIETIAEQLEWEVALVWCVDGQANVLHCSWTWHAPTISVSDFLAASRAQAISPGVGIPGRVWKNREPCWIANVLQDGNFPRLTVAAKAGLFGAFAFPIRGRSEIFGVIEFFSREIQPPDEDLLQAMNAIGAQIGQFIDRRRAERARRESEEHKGAILETALDGIITIDHAGRINEWNPAAERIFGYSRSEVLGQEMAQLIIPPSFRAQHRQGLTTYLATGEGLIIGTRIELTAMRSDGSTFPVELAITSIPTDDLPLFTGYIRDITDRRRAEEELKSYRLMVESAIDYAIFRLDLDGYITSWNIGAERIKGYQADEIIGKHFSHFYPPEELERGKPEHELRVATAEGRFEDEGWRVRKDGTRFWANVVVTALRNEQGQLTGFTKITRDLTERKRTEFAQRFLAETGTLLASSLDMQITLQNVAQLIVPKLADWCVVDLLEVDGSIFQAVVAHVDPAKEELVRKLRHRYPPDLKEQHPIWQVLSTGKPELAAEISDADLAAGAKTTEHLQMLRDLDIRSHMVVPLVARGHMLGVISFVLGQSRRPYTQVNLALSEELARRAALALDNALLYQEAQKAIQARDEFLSIASHELKTPLTTLLGHAQALQRRAARAQTMEERDQRALSIISDQALRLNKQIATLLDLSRIELGQFKFDRRPIDLSALVQRVVKDVEPTLERHNVQLTVENDSLIILGDEGSLEQAFQNLFHNAVKYSPQGGEITVHISEQANQAQVTISDQGIGIPEAAQPFLFQRFYRASNVDADYISGLGIGLYLVQEIISRHGGSVKVLSTEGQGSAFTVCLPLVADE